jgi:hypothetical protein
MIFLKWFEGWVKDNAKYQSQISKRKSHLTDLVNGSQSNNQMEKVI